MPRNMGGKTSHLWSQWEAIQESMMQIISISGTASGGRQTKAFSFFPPSRIGLLTPWLAVTLKCHVPTDTLFTSRRWQFCGGSLLGCLCRADREERLQREEGFSPESGGGPSGHFWESICAAAAKAPEKVPQLEQKTQLPSLAMVLQLLLPGPAATWGVARCVLAGLQRQTPEPQVTVRVFHVFGLSSTFFYPASAGK